MTDKPIPAPLDSEYREVGWGVGKAHEEAIVPIFINRHKVCDYDVKFETHYCGVCYSDVHAGHGFKPWYSYPMVTGHETSGVVVEVGPKVTKHKVGDKVAVGLMVDSCRDCVNCKQGDENYCVGQGVGGGGPVFTFCAPKKYPGHIGGNQETITQGGYSGSMVVTEDFVVKVPDNYPLEAAGPIMCAGITMYDPLKHFGCADGGKTVGIIGIGGLGSMGVKLAKALGNKVVAISTSENKKDLALQKGADAFVVSTDPESMKASASSIDLILNTISANHQAAHYLSLLKLDGRLVMLGITSEPHQVIQMPLIHHRKKISGSMIGGLKNSQEVMDLCAKHNIVPDITQIEASGIEEAWTTLKGKNPDAIRYVIDIKKSLENKNFLPKE